MISLSSSTAMRHKVSLTAHVNQVLQKFSGVMNRKVIPVNYYNAHSHDKVVIPLHQARFDKTLNFQVKYFHCSPLNREMSINLAKNSQNHGTTYQTDIEFPTPVCDDVFHGISCEPFSDDVKKILLAPVSPNDVEIKPDGSLYYPEIKYRRVLNNAFGPGGWAMLPRQKYKYASDQTHISVEYALYVHGRFVSQAWGDQQYSSNSTKAVATVLEGAKSNALMRCCKDLGIASELWDPEYIFNWKKEHAVKVYCQNVKNPADKRYLWRRKDRPSFDYPWKEISQEKY